MISKICKYIRNFYDKKDVKMEVQVQKLENTNINPVEEFVRTKRINGHCNANRTSITIFGDEIYSDYRIGAYSFNSKKFSSNEIEYLNQAKYHEIPDGLTIKVAIKLIDDLFTYGVEIKLSNGLKVFIQGRNNELYKRVWDCLKYQAYLQYPELFIDIQ